MKAELISMLWYGPADEGVLFSTTRHWPVQATRSVRLKTPNGFASYYAISGRLPRCCPGDPAIDIAIRQRKLPETPRTGRRPIGNKENWALAEPLVHESAVARIISELTIMLRPLCQPVSKSSRPIIDGRAHRCSPTIIRGWRMPGHASRRG